MGRIERAVVEYGGAVFKKQQQEAAAVKEQQEIMRKSQRGPALPATARIFPRLFLADVRARRDSVRIKDDSLSSITAGAVLVVAAVCAARMS